MLMQKRTSTACCGITERCSNERSKTHENGEILPFFEVLLGASRMQPPCRRRVKFPEGIGLPDILVKCLLHEALALGRYTTFVYMEDDTKISWPAMQSWAIDQEALEWDTRPLSSHPVFFFLPPIFLPALVRQQH